MKKLSYIKQIHVYYDVYCFIYAFCNYDINSVLIINSEKQISVNNIFQLSCGVMVSVLASSAVGRGVRTPIGSNQRL